MVISTISSFDEYVTHTEKYKNQFLFRGQANSDWGIVPSIFRNIELLNEEAKNITENDLFDQANILVSLFKMQHYGNPTRLIDLTISPYSALFFSIDDDIQKGKDGVVFVIDKSKAISFSDAEIDVFCDMLVDEELESKNYSEEIKKKVVEEQIIQYDYKFSYTNKRAILQGGTALLIGFGLADDKLTRWKNICLDGIIAEKIIVPSKIKADLYGRLSALGYSKSILYESFESSYSGSLFEIANHKFEVTSRADFSKIVATYKLSAIEVNRDNITNKINQLYNELFKKYGQNSRIWLFICYDDNDIEHGNWICRTQWDEKYRFNIKWTSDYYSKRLRNLNEEISTQEILDRFKPLVLHACKVEEVIKKEYLVSDYQKIITLLQENKKSVGKCLYTANDIPYGNIDIEPYAKAAISFISDVEHVISEILLYHERGETEKFLLYWIGVLLNNCRKSKESLENFKAYYC